MKKRHKKSILEYISDKDPNGKLVKEIEPTDGFRGGEIKYNENAVNLNRNISTLGSEEYVRAYLFVRLCTELGYSSGPDKIEFEKEYSIGRPSTKKARVDILVRYPACEIP